MDLHGASHLDPEMLLQLRSIAAATEGRGTEKFRVTLEEPAELPICLLHVGSDGEVLADLDGELARFRWISAATAPALASGGAAGPGAR